MTMIERMKMHARRYSKLLASVQWRDSAEFRDGSSGCRTGWGFAPNTPLASKSRSLPLNPAARDRQSGFRTLIFSSHPSQGRCNLVGIVNLDDT